MEKLPEKRGIINWIDERLPIFWLMKKELVDYKTPKNLNYLWSFGSLAGIILVVMIATGIFLAMNYVPNDEKAFDSIQHIMRDVNYGWLIRYMHMNGASIFFIVVYVHILRGLYYGSYKKPRELLWIIGVIIFLLMMATAFMGYVLPWGQMSFWGATVITNLFTAIPVIGEAIVEWILGGFAVGNPTLNRFFSLHYLFPFLIVGVVVFHLASLHMFGSNNPTGVEKKTDDDVVPFHPYFTAKDIFGLGVLIAIWSLVIFFAPDFFNDPDNYIPANRLATPPHIVPEWYFLPFYSILRSVPNKDIGVLLLFSSVFILFFVPWLDRSEVKSGRYRPIFKIFFAIFVLDCLTLGWSGAQEPEGAPLWIARFSTLYYFFYFFIVLPFVGKLEKVRPLPESIAADFKRKHPKKNHSNKAREDFKNVEKNI